jgi:RpiR family carbohydrate utilization transcriptional regulator
MNILDKIQTDMAKFSKSERKVAEAILATPQSTIHTSIALLAKQADVSEPTVNRFCRRLDTKGFPDFKLHLAQCLAHGTPYVNRHVEETDGADSYTSKIFQSSMAALNLAHQELDAQIINRAVDILTQAKTISFFGMGASTAVAQDAQNKFFRFNVPVVFYNDVLMQKMSCINATTGDVIVLISHTGRTKYLIEIARLAQKNGASVIGITSSNAPLVRECTLAITASVPEDTDVYMPMASRLVQLVIIDVLATGFTLRRGPQFRENLKRAKDVLRESRVDKEHLVCT